MAGKLPKGWRRIELHEVAEINPRADRLSATDKLTFLAMADVSESGGVLNQTVVTARDASVNGYTRFRRGDLLCAKITPCFENGKGADTASLVTEQGFGSTEFHVVRAGAAILPRLLHQIIQSIEFRRRGERFMTGSAGQKRVPVDFIEEYGITLPPLDEQRRIVAVLDAWDRQLALTQARHMASSSRYDGLLQQFMRPVELRRAPGWRRVLMADAFSERDERSDALPLLAITGNGGVVPRDSLDRRDTASEDKSKYKVIRKGDIGYNTMRMWQGVFGLSRYNGIVSPAYTVITPNTDVIDAAFAAHLFAHPRVVHMFHRYSQGLVDDTLMLKFPHFSEIRLPLPDLWTQKAIAKAMDAVQLEIGKRAELVQAVERQKRGLMQLLLSGEKRLLRDLPGMEAAA